MNASKAVRFLEPVMTTGFLSEAVEERGVRPHINLGGQFMVRVVSGFFVCSFASFLLDCLVVRLLLFGLAG